jgi:hypothetical protein
LAELAVFVAAVVIAFTDAVIGMETLKGTNVNEDTKVLDTVPTATKYTKMTSKVPGRERCRLRLTIKKEVLV